MDSFTKMPPKQADIQHVRAGTTKDGVAVFITKPINPQTQGDWTVTLLDVSKDPTNTIRPPEGTFGDYKDKRILAVASVGHTEGRGEAEYKAMADHADAQAAGVVQIGTMSPRTWRSWAHHEMASGDNAGGTLLLPPTEHAGQTHFMLSNLGKSTDVVLNDKGAVGENHGMEVGKRYNISLKEDGKFVAKSLDKTQEKGIQI